MDLEVRHLRLVAAVAEHRSLTKAGDVLHLTQSALSHQLRGIEERLGARLFHRLNKRMVPTPAGERLLESAARILVELGAAEQAIRSGDTARPVILRLSTECYTCYHWLPPVLKPFRKAFPQVDVRIDPGAASDPFSRLLQGRIDLAIVSSRVKHSRLVVRPLFDDEQVLVVAPDHPLAGERFARLADFRRERLLTYTPADESSFIVRVLRPAGITPDRVDVVKLTEAALELVAAGLGVTVLSRWAAAPYAARGAVRMVRITADGYARPWAAAMPAHLADTDYVKEFLRLVIANAPTGPRAEVLPFRNRGRRARVATFASRR